MRLTLKPHPDTPCAAVREIAVEAVRGGGSLALVFAVSGDIEAILLPAAGSRQRADDLWKHTCFEAFIAPCPLEGSYKEINLSPSNQWAAYSFDGYRAGMADSVGFELVRLDDTRGADRYDLSADLKLDLPDTSWSLGLSAVIELKDGSKSYWALAHAPGQPDFHHRDAFAATLSPETP